MRQAEKDLRLAAGAFADAADKAKEDGYDFQWPHSPQELRELGITETAKVEPEPAKKK